jgi:pentatricopeptide repeat protein
MSSSSSRRFHDAALAELSRSGTPEAAERAVKILERMPVSEITATVLNLVMDCCNNGSAAEQARAVFHWFARRNLMPDEFSFFQLIRTLQDSGDFPSAVLIYDHMISLGVFPRTLMVYSSLFRVIANHAVPSRERLALAWDVVGMMLVAGLQPLQTSFCLIASLVDETEIEEVLRRMPEFGLAPSVEIVNIVLHKVLARRRTGLADAMMIMNAMEPLVRLDLVSFNTVMRAAARAGEHALVWELLVRLQALRIKPDQRTYTFLLESAPDLVVVREVLFSTARAPGAAPADLVTYMAGLQQCAKHHNKGGLALAREIAEAAERAGPIPATERGLRFYNTLMSVYAAAGDFEAGFRLVRAMGERGAAALAPDLGTFTALVEAVARSTEGGQAELQRVKDLMDKHGLAWAPGMFAAIVARVRSASFFDTKDHALQELQRLRAANEEIKPSFVNTLLAQMARRGKDGLQEVQAFLKEARAAGFGGLLNTSSFQEVVMALLEADRLDDALVFFRLIGPTYGLQVDLGSFYAVLGSFLKRGDVEGAERFFQTEIDGSRPIVSPSSDPAQYLESVFTLMNAYMRSQPVPLVARAIAAFERFVTSRGVEPGDDVLRLLLHAYAAEADVDRALEVIVTRTRLGFPNTDKDFGLVLHVCACASPPNPDKAFQVLEMLRSFPGFKMTVVILNLLLNVLAKAGRVDSAIRVLSLGEASGVAPNAITIATLIHACSKAGRVEEAFRVFALHPQPDNHAFCSLMDACARTKNVERALQLLELMDQQRIKPDVITMNTLVNACCRADQPDRAWALVDRMARSAVPIDAYTFGPFFSMFLRRRDLDGAQHFFWDVMKSHFRVQPNCHIIARCINICHACGQNRLVAQRFLAEATQCTPQLEKACSHFVPPIPFDFLPKARDEDDPLHRRKRN